MLEKLLRSRAEVAVLGIALFSDNLHLREIARRAGVSPYEAKRELDALVKIGLLSKSEKGNMLIFYQNRSCPFFLELRGLYLKTEGAIPLLQKALAGLSAVRYAFIYGSFASGRFTEKSDIDLFVIGKIRQEALDRICFDVQNKTGREINYILWDEADFAKKIREGGAFVSSLLEKEKLWLKGDENGFERDATEARDSKGRARQ